SNTSPGGGPGAFWLAVRKELQAWFRDPKVFAASVLAPLVLLLAFNAIFGKGRAWGIAVTDLDGSRASGRLLELIGAKDSELGGKYFRVVPVGPEERERLYAEGRVLAWLAIPKGFGENLQERRESTLTLGIDNYNSDFAKNIRLYLNEAFVDLYGETYPEVRFAIEQRREAGAKVGWIDSIGMGLTGLAIVLAGMFNGFNGLLSEYQTQTIKSLLLSPRSLTFIFGAKAVYAAFGAVLSGSLMLVVLRLITGLPLAHGLAGFLLLAALTGLIYVGLGMIIGLFIRRYMPAAAVSMVFGVTSWFMSGSLGELRLYNHVIQVIAAFLPITYTQEGLRGLLLYGTGSALWVNAAYLALALVVTLLALVATVRRKFVLG
ncbi:MAG: ABC transporter permease, partial [Actinobacteria bacterium]|nr:ABC transporter permease [Actinomycetota bacterium]